VEEVSGEKPWKSSGQWITRRSKIAPKKIRDDKNVRLEEALMYQMGVRRKTRGPGSHAKQGSGPSDELKERKAKRGRKKATKAGEDRHRKLCRKRHLKRSCQNIEKKKAGGTPTVFGDEKHATE